jgi:hypothetical protein
MADGSEKADTSGDVLWTVLTGALWVAVAFLLVVLVRLTF